MVLKCVFVAFQAEGYKLYMSPVTTYFARFETCIMKCLVGFVMEVYFELSRLIFSLCPNTQMLCTGILISTLSVLSVCVCLCA